MKKRVGLIFGGRSGEHEVSLKSAATIAASLDLEKFELFPIFISREGKYYIVDLNSANRTFVDGQVIPANVEIPIKHGSKIKLANEEFEFVHSSCVYGEV